MQSLLELVKRGKGADVPLSGRYKDLSAKKSGYLTRGQQYSKFTLPYILPYSVGLDRGDAGNQHGFQGIGAQAVNHLSNKLTTNMFPIGRSFFKLSFGEEVEALLKKDNYDPTQLAELLVSAEKRVEKYQTEIGSRVAYVESFKNLLISGNVLIHLPATGNLQAIKLDRYCVKRNLSGELVELMIMEEKEFSTLSKYLRERIKVLRKEKSPEEDAAVKIYTWVYLIDGQYAVAQSVEDVLIKDVEYISKDELPWFPLRWNATYGEDYGRGLVEDHSGDFYVIEFLSEAIAKGMALMADIKYLIKPGSVTDIDAIATAPTGEWVFGQLDDIGVLQLEKYADFTPISEVLTKYERRIGQAFLINSAMRRDAERVTTLELKLDATELEVSLGGNYSLLSQTYLTPLANIYLYRVNFPFPKGVVPTIISGLAVFGEAGELDKLYQFTEMMQLPREWPEQVQGRVKWNIYARDIAANLSMTLSFMMSDEEFAKKNAAEQGKQDDDLVKETVAGAVPNIIDKV